jgi:hypothetical protein
MKNDVFCHFGNGIPDAITKKKGKAVPLHAMEALGGEEV